MTENSFRPRVLRFSGWGCRQAVLVCNYIVGPSIRRPWIWCYLFQERVLPFSGKGVTFLWEGCYVFRGRVLLFRGPPVTFLWGGCYFFVGRVLLFRISKGNTKRPDGLTGPKSSRPELGGGAKDLRNTVAGIGISTSRRPRRATPTAGGPRRSFDSGLPLPSVSGPWASQPWRARLLWGHFHHFFFQMTPF